MLKRSILLAAAASVATVFAVGTVAAQAAPEHRVHSGMAMNWYGGPAYMGAPASAATAALMKAGGGAENFSFPTALVSMLGEKTVNAEVAKLTTQYGKAEADMFINGMTFDVKDGLKRATEAGVKLPAAPADLKGAKLATTLVGAGTAPDGVFWSGYLFDHALSHKLHNQVMIDVTTKFGAQDNLVTHKILNQAMYDVAQALGHKKVQLASLH